MQDAISIHVAAISAIAAIAGAVISQVVSIAGQHLDRNHQRRILLRERYEQLAEHITSSQEWPNSLLACTSHGELARAPHPTHARNALTLSSIYFPELQSACQDYVNSCVNFRLFLINYYRPGPETQDVGTIVAYLNAEGFRAVSQQLHLARQNVDDLIIAKASKYAKA